MEKRKPSYTVGRNVNWCSIYGDSMEVPLKKKKKNIELLCHPVIPLLDVYSKKIIIQKD